MNGWVRYLLTRALQVRKSKQTTRCLTKRLSAVVGKVGIAPVVRVDTRYGRPHIDMSDDFVTRCQNGSNRSPPSAANSRCLAMMLHLPRHRKSTWPTQDHRGIPRALPERPSVAECWWDITPPHLLASCGCARSGQLRLGPLHGLKKQHGHTILAFIIGQGLHCSSSGRCRQHPAIVERSPRSVRFILQFPRRDLLLIFTESSAKGSLEKVVACLHYTHACSLPYTDFLA